MSLHLRSTPSRRRPRTVFRRVAAGLSLALLAAACQGSGGAEDPETAADGNDEADSELAPIGYQTSFLFSGWDSPVLLAYDRGYYEEEGLEVTITEGSGSGAALQSLLGGLNDIVSAEGGTMAIQGTQDEELVTVANLAATNGMAVVSLKDDGHEITMPEDVEGKRLGISLDSSEAGILPQFLEANGVDMDTVDVENVGIAQKAQFLQAGTVDAIAYFSYSAVSIAPLDDMDFVMLSDYGTNILGFGLVTTRTYADENADEVAAFIRATERGFAEAKADPEAAIDALMERTDVLERDAAMVQWEMFQELMSDDALPFGHQSEDMWSEMLADFVDAGVLEKPREADTYFTTEHLPSDD